jgi:hypothetical protein
MLAASLLAEYFTRRHPCGIMDEQQAHYTLIERARETLAEAESLLPENEEGNISDEATSE